VFHYLGGAKLRGLAILHVPELANRLRLSTKVSSQDLSGAWVTIWG
jgi:hypothetical protein